MMKKRHPHKENVLLVNITRLGDMLQATPTIAGVKMENPNAKITVLVEKQFEEVCRSIPNIDRVVGLDLGMTVRSLTREQDGIIDAFEYVSEVVNDLREQRFDYCLNMSSSPYTALLLKLIDVPRSGGWRSDEEGFRVIESSWAQLFATSVFHQNRQFNSLNLVDVFRCSADVEQHPQNLLLNVDAASADYARELIASAKFPNRGPLIAIQAGASQAKRQWSTGRFVKMIQALLAQTDARIVMTGTKKELEIIQPIVDACASPNVFVAAGKTSISQLAALLKSCELLITGDTGPMHIATAVGTPVVAMFLASAYGYETGPYREGSLILQPVIACGPCNPNKACLGVECHETLDPEVVAKLSIMRVHGDVTEIPAGLVNPNQMIVYRTFFDRFGFYDLQPLTDPRSDSWRFFRDAYRRLWLDELAGFVEPAKAQSSNRLRLSPEEIPGLTDVMRAAERGRELIQELMALIDDPFASGSALGQTNAAISELDREIEGLGFHYSPLGPVTRMFVFARENLAGSEARDLASQMQVVYEDLKRRCEKLSAYFQMVQ